MFVSSQQWSIICRTDEAGEPLSEPAGDIVIGQLMEGGKEDLVRGHALAAVKAHGFHLALGRIQADPGQGMVITVADPFKEAGSGPEGIVQGLKGGIVLCHGLGGRAAGKVVGVKCGMAGLL